MVMDRYDVIVIGAGPAGSTTAYYAAKNKLNVLILEKKKEIGYPVQCGEFLPTVDEIREILPKVNNLGELFAIKEKLISKRTTSIKIFSSKRKCYELKFNGFSVERREFDKYLVEKAVKMGAELRTDVKVTGIDGHRVITNGGDFISKVIVGADGPFSKVAGWMGLRGPKKLSPCILCEIPGDFEPTVEMYFGSVAPGGYAWVIPKATGANIGLGVQKKSKVPLKSLLLKFLKSIDINAKPRFWSAGHVPVSGPIPQTVKGNVIVVGDAAGHVMATNGGGIPIAMICGRIAGNVIGRHINSESPLEDYETEWRQAVGRELKTALMTKRLADLSFKSDWTLDLAMRIMGTKRMDLSIKCKPIFGGWRTRKNGKGR
ncbi:MAG: NAD(P)/FAD-dependent oxidoreductase [Candidatus Thermoplasmatota archaeon]|jgi:digeranylgeranylglycerophospholipid reductase|nr:NAD(P)/FAD-dependent oxidoreductase [Candidatus Thermoplasmatota archaeon]